MKHMVVRKANALAKRLYGISMRAPAMQRESVAQMVLFESNESLPAVYRFLRSRGLSMASSLEKTYGAYLSYSRTGGLGTEDEDFDLLLGQLAEGGTSGTLDTASTQTSEDRAWDVDRVLDTIERSVDVGTDVVTGVYDAVVDRLPSGVSVDPGPQGADMVAHMQSYYRRKAAGGLVVGRPLPSASGNGAPGGMTTPMSPTTIALGVGAAVLLGYALLGGKKKRK